MTNLERDALFMVLLGCTPEGRNTEQHDVFFGVAPTLRALAPQFERFWPGVRVHVDAYMKVEHVDGYDVAIVPRGRGTAKPQLYFVNLGGYKPGVFEELHEKHLVVANSVAGAVARCRSSAFFAEAHGGTRASRSHVDDKHAARDLVVVDDDTFPVQDKIAGYGIRLVPAPGMPDSEPVIGYLPMAQLEA